MAMAINDPVSLPNDKWAVVVGVSNHFDPSIIPLKFAAKNATNFADFLMESEHFAKDHVLVLLNEKATRLAILDALGGKSQSV